jgi:hypothetical protein
MVMVLYKSVNTTSVSSTTKMNGELLHVKKDIHLSGVIVHSKTLKSNLNTVKVNGIVMILKLSLLLISNTSISTMMEFSMLMTISC